MHTKAQDTPVALDAAHPRTVSNFAASQNDADTYGWDTAFALSFTTANTAITAAWAQVDQGAKNLEQVASDDSSYHIDAVLGPWQLTEGGDGKNVRMACPIASGSYTAGSKVFDLDEKNVQVVIEVGMEWVPNPDQKNFQLTGSEVAPIRSALDQNQIADRLRTEFVNHQMALSSSATALLIQQGKEWLITDSKLSYYIFYETDKDNNQFFYIYQFAESWATNLKLLAKAVSDTQPAVVVVTITSNPTSGVAASVLSDLLSTWFNTNIGQFNHVFASLNLTPILSQSDKYKWMKPTSSTYAVTDQGSLDTSIFGVLTMTLGNKPGANHQVSPYAIPAGADAGGANAGFLISGPSFMQNMLLAGAQSIFNNAPASSFEIINDGLTVQNTADMVWGKFMMDNKSMGTIVTGGFPAELDKRTISQNLRNALRKIGVSGLRGYRVTVTSAGSQWLLSNGKTNTYEYILNLSDDKGTIGAWIATTITIPKGQFKMSLVHTYVEIEFINLNYSYSSDFDVHVNYTEQVQLTLKDVGGGKKVFWLDQIAKSMIVNVTKTTSAITREIVEGAVMAVLSLVAIIGPVIQGLRAGAEIAEVSEDAGEAILDAETFESVAESESEAETLNEADAMANAGEQAGGKMTAIKNAFNTPKWKFVGALAALAGAVTGVDTTVGAIIEAAAKNEWEKVPGFDDFAQLAIVPYTFPNVSGFTLTSSWLAGSLQIGLKTKSQS